MQPKDWQSCLTHIKTKAKELEQELALLQGRPADPTARQLGQAIQGLVHDACQAHRRLARIAMTIYESRGCRASCEWNMKGRFIR